MRATVLEPGFRSVVFDCDSTLTAIEGIDVLAGERLGEIQALTPSIDALFVPNIDDSLDEENAKREFWRAFRRLGDWYSDLPPW